MEGSEELGEAQCLPREGNTCPQGLFPFTNFNLLFPFPKSQAEAKAGESRKGPGLGGSWLMAVGTGFWAVIVEGQQNREGGSLELLNRPCTSQA